MISTILILIGVFSMLLVLYVATYKYHQIKFRREMCEDIADELAHIDPLKSHEATVLINEIIRQLRAHSYIHRGDLVRNFERRRVK